MVARVPFSKVLNSLLLKQSPTSIYSYQFKPSLNFATGALSFVFFAYGVTFTSWSWKSAFEILETSKENEELADKTLWEKTKFYTITMSPFALSLLPFTVSFGAMLVKSRVVTNVNYIPKIKPNEQQLVQFTHKSFITGRPVVTDRLVSSITRSGRVRIFSGKGVNGTEDRNSFVFYLTDNDPSSKHFWNKFYVLPRSGQFYMNDARLFDALFGGDSIRMLNSLKFSENNASIEESTTKNYKQADTEAELNKIKMNKIIDKTSQRPRIHSTSAKNIVKNINLNHNKDI